MPEWLPRQHIILFNTICCHSHHHYNLSLCGEAATCWPPTLGLVSTTIMWDVLGLERRMQSSSCSSSSQRALNPDSGWEERQRAAWSRDYLCSIQPEIIYYLLCPNMLHWKNEECEKGIRVGSKDQVHGKIYLRTLLQLFFCDTETQDLSGVKGNLFICYSVTRQLFLFASSKFSQQGIHEISSKVYCIRSVFLAVHTHSEGTQCNFLSGIQFFTPMTSSIVQYSHQEVTRCHYVQITVMVLGR